MSEKNKQLNTIVKGGFLLTIASFISKVLSALYKVPFQNWTGDEGFYVYQQVYPIYGIAIALTLTGLPAFVSKIVSESRDEETLQKELQSLHTWLALIGVSLFLLLQIGAGFIANAMGDVLLTPVIRRVSWFFLVLPFLALARGFFQGQVNMAPTSLSQVGEQLVRVAILIGVAYYFTTGEWTVYEMGANAYHSAWVSGLAASLILVYYLIKSSHLSLFKSFLKPRWERDMGRRLFSEGIGLIFVSSLTVIFQFVDSFTVFNGLIEAGFSNHLAMSLKGVYDRGQPLVQLGLVVGTGFAMTALPVLRKNVLKNENLEWAQNVTSVIKITILLSSAAAVGLIAVMPWMNVTLFTDRAGTNVLQVMMVSIFLTSLIYCLHTVLQSANQVGSSWLILIIGLLFKTLMNRLAVRHLGIMGSSVVTVFALVIIVAFMVQSISPKIWQNVLKDKFIVKQTGLLIGLYGIVWGSMSLIQNFVQITERSGHFILVLIGVAIGGLFYGVTAYKLNLLTEHELTQLNLPTGFKRK